MTKPGQAHDGSAFQGPATAVRPGCRACRAPACDPFDVIGGLVYWSCPACQVVLLDERQLPSPGEEAAHYRLHRNEVDDPRYRAFLSRLAGPVLERLPPAAAGLDYGCGPGPALAAMLREQGHSVSLYDPFFQPDEAVLQRTYGFIVCSEVIEHFHQPAEEFDRLDSLLEPGGMIGLMTCFRTADQRFRDWHYRRDPTHVAFYREETLRHLARQRGWSCEIPRKDVAILRKPGGSGCLP